jgi:outer membrane protein OmpA-like peptidoglycan-associated protein
MHAILKEATSAKHVHIRGYTDIIGTIPGNKRLAMARAIEIRTHLIKSGIPLDKLSTSYCIDCFADSNETREGRTANRRAVVEMLLGPEFAQGNSSPAMQ